MSQASLSEENAALKALLAQTQAALVEHQVALAQSEEARRRLEAIVSDLRRDKFGAKSEKLSPEQFNLPLEDIEIAQGILDATQERAEAVIKGKRQEPNGPRRSRGHLPAHLPRVEQVIEPESTMCPCGCGQMARIDEDTSERLDRVPAQLRVLVTRRPKYACRRCSGAVVQAHAPERVVPSGLPTEALIAQIVEAHRQAPHLCENSQNYYHISLPHLIAEVIYQVNGHPFEILTGRPLEWENKVTQIRRLLRSCFRSSGSL
ncbi:IS66 family transposase zinc-finger binding domain-containing protein (plasmid) [Rhizobium sp. CC1099]|uniref:IS66 family transposase zinc-finger binding domain-containing protein n=1 Tax=Rhizobium sp. CC1099 TaxID=3039160 RepID=UPI0024B05517|nr:IS66 family transposase zinc-finger binding domain-containing protein [Rhizobium sp. CC1099]WFU91982.1 IS66 family transposase zinc-finger binding domain-containing protein [Rhizobium sp. CC1099]